MKNVRLKAWSLLIACAISYFVNSQTNAGVVTLVAPVELRNLPKNKVVVEPENAQAQVKLRGPSHTLAGLYSNPPSFKLRYEESSGNSFTAPLQASQLGIPTSLEVLLVDPPQIHFSLDTLVMRDIPIVVPRIGEPPTDYRVENLVISPGVVNIRGPESAVKGLSVIETAPLDLRELRDAREGMLILRLPGKLVEANVQSVQYKLSVQIIRDEKIFSKRTLRWSGLGDPPASVSPGAVKVEVSGPRGMIDRLKEEDVVAFIGAADQKLSGPTVLTVGVKLPAGIDLVQVEPKTVSVRP